MVLFKQPKMGKFPYKPQFYQPPDEPEEDQDGKRRIKFDRFPRERQKNKPVVWFAILLGLVLYLMYLLGTYR